MQDAVKPGAALVHDDAAGNLCYDWHIGDKAMVDGVFAKAAKVVKLDLTNNRLVPNAMEPRAAIGECDPSNGDFTLYTTSQNPHVIRLLMGAFVLHIPESKLRVVAPDVGGGLRLEDLPLRRGGDRHLGRRQAAPPGEVDRRAQRKLHVGRARPRPCHHRRDGARRGRQFPGAARLDPGQHGRLSLHLRALHPDLSLRHVARRRTRCR